MSTRNAIDARALVAARQPRCARRNGAVVLTAALAWAMLSGAAPAWGQQERGRAAVGDFEVEDLSGRRIRLADLGGRVVVITFWATWCAPCLQELPFLQGFYEDHAEEGLIVLAIAMDGPETQSLVRRVVRRHRLTMPVILDADGSLTAQLNPRSAAPFTLFVDRHGRRAASHEGYSSGDERLYHDLIRDLLAEPAP